MNIDYPLGVAAYNILREVAVDSSMLRGVYVLGKAATLNADVGDVMLSTVVHDEHSGSTYWLDNAFSVDDIAPDLRFGSGLDNQRAVTVKSTFLQNRSYLDFYYREAFTVVEMEAGPYCNAHLRDRRRRPPPGERGGQLLEAAGGLRDHPLRLRHALHAGAHAGRARAELLRDRLHVRVVARDPPARPAAGGRARVAAVGDLIYMTIASLDGYMEDENGDYQWSAPDEEVHAFINELLRPVGTHLYGRRMYEVMRVWETPEALPDATPAMLEFADVWRPADKVVYSRTLETVTTDRTRLERDFDAGAVRELKASAERDLTIGGPELAAHAIRAGLVDEYQLLVVPVLLGGGIRSVPDGVRAELELVEERRFESGFVYLRYRVA